ncbi:DUF445 domain-containing protein [Aeromicrobium sp. YIM 150415]|uniref:DUF445 domain-containing protein n=1 Tax=Aeromicrobium sp. YIM 150415 TaxID=2803912 RepID=UPI001963AEED|nr:DUF445 domain-containing protein [Aeromicrobium sp. YIM 150415]MBM9462566.1 DUF445 domain-containing protein [Aeromicrobium sp. YIM 150415]
MTSIALSPDVAGADHERRRRLRRMRIVATSFLFAAAVVFVLTLDGRGWVGYVHAASEAAMVGAIADWFAVTALFKRPLGLPIPHTALIPRKKEQLGASLQEFVSENFMQPQIVKERIEEAQVARRAGEWLAAPRHAERIVAEGAQIGADVLEAISPADVEAIWNEVVVPRLVDERISPAVGQLLGEIVDDGAHTGLVDLMLDELSGWIDRHPERITGLVTERAPGWAPEWANRLVAERILREVTTWLADIRDDQEHSARRALDHWLADLADDLQHDDETMEAAERLKARLLSQPKAVATATRLWEAFRQTAVTALRDDDGLLRRRIISEVIAFAERLQHDPALAARVDRAVSDAAGHLVERYGPEVATIISATVDRWDGKETARRVELLAGRDLQFIRINGTVVGGLVGLVLHALVSLLG